MIGTLLIPQWTLAAKVLIQPSRFRLQVFYLKDSEPPGWGMHVIIYISLYCLYLVRGILLATLLPLILWHFILYVHTLLYRVFF